MAISGPGLAESHIKKRTFVTTAQVQKRALMKQGRYAGDIEESGV